MQLGQQGQAIGTDGRVFGHDHDVLEEVVHGTTGLGQRGQGSIKFTGFKLGLGNGLQFLNLGSQLTLGGLDQQLVVQCCQFAFGFLEQIADALVGGSQALGFRALGKRGASLNAGVNLFQRWTQGQHGVDHAALVIVAELIAVTLVDEGLNRIDRVIGQNPVLEEGSGGVQQRIQIQAIGLQLGTGLQLFVGADQAQRRTAQGVGVAFASWSQTNAPDTDQNFGTLGQEQNGLGQAGFCDRLVQTVTVLLANSQHDVLGLAIALGVVSAHHALQLGE